jgi:pSer/pThr/pTyr-binding forkhead associated (FHA) protein
MAESVTISLSKMGTGPARRLVFSGPARCVVGRGRDCDLDVGNDEVDCLVSRRHCVLEIDPPQVRVRDLGSLNGTYLNGESIGQRGQDTTAHPVTDRDEIWVGTNVLRVEVGRTAPTFGALPANAWPAVV